MSDILQCIAKKMQRIAKFCRIANKKFDFLIKNLQKILVADCKIYVCRFHPVSRSARTEATTTIGVQETRPQVKERKKERSMEQKM